MCPFTKAMQIAEWTARLTDHLQGQMLLNFEQYM